VALRCSALTGVGIRVGHHRRDEVRARAGRFVGIPGNNPVGTDGDARGRVDEGVAQRIWGKSESLAVLVTIRVAHFVDGPIRLGRGGPAECLSR